MTPMRMVLAAALAVIAGPVMAQTTSECSPNSEGCDVYEAAAMIQRHLASTLPMRVSREMVVTTVVVSGRRLVMTATWELTEVQFNDQLKAHNLTIERFQVKMQRFTQHMVCGLKPVAAFLRLGGEVQYSYVTNDGHPIVAPVIKGCE